MNNAPLAAWPTVSALPPVEATDVTAAKPIRPFTIWRPSEFIAYQEPEDSHLLLPKFLSLGRITSIIGQPGVGKSRCVLWLAICQITQQPWCGIDTGGGPQRWLIMGDENSADRLRDDLGRMLGSSTQPQQDSVEEHLRIQAVVEPEDGDLDLLDVHVYARCVETLKAWRPRVIVVDPLASFYGGDLSKPGEMKSAVRLVERVVREGAPGAAVGIIHHARPGKDNILQAVGWDAGNYGAGGKALLARSRCVINLAEADDQGSGNIVIACAKANDCQRFTVRAAVLDRATMSYRLDGTFDLDHWKATIAGKAKPGEGLVDLKTLVEAVRDGIKKASDLKRHFKETFDASGRTVERKIKAACKASYLVSQKRGVYELGPEAPPLLGATA